MPDSAQGPPCPQCGKTFAPHVRICPDDGTVLEHDTKTSQLGKVLDGKYRLESFLSQGGMGAVYRATHVMLGKTVAVKLINPELVTSPDVVRRFQREARSATALSHPNIVSVFDLGQTTEGTLYIAMEYVDGGSLKSAISAGGPIDAVRVVAIMRQVAAALAVAHRNKIIHRDLKPQNIMLTRGGGGEEVAKLVDFGIAKTFDEATQLTMAGDAIGTPHYMAPEQAAGKPVDARSDIYSAGIILYEMLSGEVPFNDTSAPAILIKHLQETPVPPSTKNVNVAVPPALEAIALKCLEKDPARRYQTAEELGAALDHAAATLPAASVLQAQATVPMSAASAGMPEQAGAAAGAATVPMAAARPPAASPAPAPTVRAASVAAGALPPASALAARAADTRPTVAAPQAAHASASVAVAPAAAAPKASKKPLAIVAAVFVVAIAAAVAMQMQRGTAPADSQQAAGALAPAAAPAASPAMATPTAPAPSSALATPTAPAAPSAQGSIDPTEPAASTSGASTPAPAPASAPGASAPAGAISQPAGRQTAAVPSVVQVPAPVTAQKRAVGDVATSPDRPRASSPSGVAAGAPQATTPPAATNPPARQAPASAPAQPPAPSATFPANPSVAFQCAGAAEICSPLRAAMDDALEKAGLPSVRNASRADVSVSANANAVTGQTNRQFGTTFTVMNYSIDVSGEATKTSEAVAMPASKQVSFDQQFGSQRATEAARVLASDIVDRIKAFAAKKR